MLESYVQTNFSAGEWSPPFQGRTDDKEYVNALRLCLNYIPNQEGSLSPRSGFKRCGLTKDGEQAKFFDFRFDSWTPYVAEHTANNLRFWANGLPIFATETASFVSVSGDPPTFVIQDNRSVGTGLVPAEWANGDSVMIKMSTTADIETAGYLAQREWTITIVSASAGTIRLTDALTGTPLSGAVTASGTITFHRILDLDTPYDYINDIRQVAFTAQWFSQTADSVPTEPDHRVTYLEIANSPRSLSANLGIQVGLQKENFIDGPYLDSPSKTIPMTVSGTTGTITIQVHHYSTTIIYKIGDVVWSGANLAAATYHVSLASGNVNQAVPTAPAATPYWASMPLTWSAATTYFLGQPAMGGPASANGVSTIYYSVQAANLNHALTDASWWSTTPPTYAGGTTYSDGAVVVDSSINYVSLVGANLGNTPASSPTFWLPIDFETALDEIQNSATGWPAIISFVNNDAGDALEDNLARLIRLKAGPQPWNVAATYTTDDLVNYKDNIYKSLIISNLGNIPDQDPVSWEIQSATIQWTWAKFVSIEDSYTADILIMGDDLPSSDPVWEFRMGVFSDTTGWPTCGTYHEGRIWLSGAQPNRIDAGMSNLGFNFAPTAPDGTVADNNAISYVLNTSENETINSMISITEGVMLNTSSAEWLVSASATNDPITPTSIQAHRTTAFSAAPFEPTRLPTGFVIPQNGGRRLMEYRTFVDMSSYQSRLNAVDMTRKCQHLTGDGLGQTGYQRLPQPVIWACPAGIVSTTLQVSICPVPVPGMEQSTIVAKGTLFGIGYAREPEFQYTAPFSFEHGMTYDSGTQVEVYTIAVQRGYLVTAEYLYAQMFPADGIGRVEMLMPVFESSPFDDTYTGGTTVATFGTLSGAYMVDSGITPAACKIAADGLSCTFYGMADRAGETLAFTCRGKYVGDYLISATGTATVTFNSAFAKTDIGRAMWTVPNATLLPATFQSFYLDKNGNTGVYEPATASTGFRGQFGYAYRRRGQMLRPPIVGRNGPAYAKLRRNHKMGVYVDKAQEISIGYSFSNLHPLTLTPEGGSVVEVTTSQFTTGIFRDDVEDEQSFDGGLCWEQTRPVPGAILAVGGFANVEDV